jgi:hypothetical protein
VYKSYNIYYEIRFIFVFGHLVGLGQCGDFTFKSLLCPLLTKNSPGQPPRRLFIADVSMGFVSLPRPPSIQERDGVWGMPSTAICELFCGFGGRTQTTKEGRGSKRAVGGDFLFCSFFQGGIRDCKKESIFFSINITSQLLLGYFCSS